jgi:hypothetical protein
MNRKVFWNVRQGDMIGIAGLLMLLIPALWPIIKFVSLALQ